MSYGLELRDDSGAVQISSTFGTYVCIYAQEGSRLVNYIGGLDSDIILVTFRVGTSTVYVESIEGKGLYLRGGYRTLVFRKSELVDPALGGYGVVVFNERGDLTYSSNFHLLEFTDTYSFEGGYFVIIGARQGVAWYNYVKDQIPLGGILLKVEHIPNLDKGLISFSG